MPLPICTTTIVIVSTVTTINLPTFTWPLPIIFTALASYWIVLTRGKSILFYSFAHIHLRDFRPCRLMDALRAIIIYAKMLRLLLFYMSVPCLNLNEGWFFRKILFDVTYIIINIFSNVTMLLLYHFIIVLNNKGKLWAVLIIFHPQV